MNIETNRIEYKQELTEDLELVEYLGSGMPRILKAYGKRSFKFSENFLRIVFLKEKVQGVEDVSAPVGTKSGTKSGPSQ